MSSKIQQQSTTTVTTGGQVLNGPSLLGNLYVGKEVIFSGNLETGTDSATSANTLVLPSNEKVGLISTQTVISNYSGPVSIRGKVSSYQNNMYIIDVDFITSDMNMALTTTPEENNQKTYISNANLLIDTSNASDTINVQATGSSITLEDITTPDTGDILTINYFTCQKGDPVKDCQQILNATDGSSEFTGTQGVAFHKLSETNERFTINGSIGYMISTPKDAFLYAASAYIGLLSPATMGAQAVTSAPAYCFNTDSSLSSVTTQSTVNQGSAWITTIKGVDNTKNTITCTLETDIGDHSTTTHLVTYVVGAPSTTSPTTTPANGGTKTPPPSTIPPSTGTTTPPTSISTPPASSSTGLTFVSTRGNYTIYFPTQRIIFNGLTVTETFGLQNTNCYADIQIKDYKYRNDDSVGAGVDIFECVTQLTVDSIKASLSNDIITPSKDGTKVFIIRTNDASWANFSSGVIIQ